MIERAWSVQHRLGEFQRHLRKMLPLVEGLLQAREVQEPEASYAADRKDRTAQPADSRYRIESVF
jgi:hypothetical protein